MNCKERLTMHTPEGASLIINANNEIDARQELHDKFKLACNKLAELEDKLENGTLIELPCRVGDTVYIIRNFEVKEATVCYWMKEASLIKTSNSDFYRARIKLGDVVTFYNNSFGKTVFFTREEAEARLKELQND